MRETWQVNVDVKWVTGGETRAVISSEVAWQETEMLGYVISAMKYYWINFILLSPAFRV